MSNSNEADTDILTWHQHFLLSTVLYSQSEKFSHLVTFSSQMMPLVLIFTYQPAYLSPSAWPQLPSWPPSSSCWLAL
uniref:Uncharacterized protein n=1 Tax=Arundo donax TaxID=35708 RepID=A0A0A8Y7B7_ARUDO